MKWLWNILHKKSPINSRGIFYSAISKTIGYAPNNLSLFETAFTHRSLNEASFDGQPIIVVGLVFLVDALLGSVIAAYLYLNAPKSDEGYLTQMRSNIVSRSHLNSVGKK